MKELKWLMPYIKRYKNRLLLGLVFVTISNICSTYMPSVVGSAVDKLSKGTFTQYMIITDIIYILSLTLGSGLFMFLTRRTIIVASRLIEYDLRYDLIRAVESRSINFFHGNSTGSLMAYATNDIPAAREFLGPAIMYGANTITTFIFALYFMLYINVDITLVSILPLPVIAFMTYFLGKKVHVTFGKVQEKYADLTTQAQEAFSGMRIVRAYTKEDTEMKRFKNISEEYLVNNLKLARLQSAMMPGLTILVGLSIVIALGYGGWKVIHGAASLGDLTQFFIYLNMLIWPVAAIGWITNIVQRAAASAGRLGRLIDNSKIKEEYDNKQAKDIEIFGNISFENVSLKYENTQNFALSDISFELTAGETLGIVGGVGAGKSSLVNLLPRLFTPESGNIKIEGVSVNNIKYDTLRRSIGFVPQDPFLFSMSIAENIKFGNESATNQEIIKAAETACLDEEVAAFEKGYDTILGERGVTLSGGQKQRCAIARAVLRNPKILVLDDSLSAVDTATEASLLANLKSITQNRTTIIISHRISSVKNADKIIVLENGKIIEKGNHAELIALNGYYADIFSRQQLEDEISKL